MYLAVEVLNFGGKVDSPNNANLKFGHPDSYS